MWRLNSYSTSGRVIRPTSQAVAIYIPSPIFGANPIHTSLLLCGLPSDPAELVVISAPAGYDTTQGEPSSALLEPLAEPFTKRNFPSPNVLILCHDRFAFVVKLLGCRKWRQGKLTTVIDLQNLNAMATHHECCSANRHGGFCCVPPHPRIVGQIRASLNRLRAADGAQVR